MQAIDDYIPDPTRALDKPFSLPVEDVFSIQGRGTVVTGRVEQGVVKVGEEIEIIGIQPPTKTTVTGQCLSLLPSLALQSTVHVIEAFLNASCCMCSIAHAATMNMCLFTSFVSHVHTQQSMCVNLWIELPTTDELHL